MRKKRIIAGILAVLCVAGTAVAEPAYQGVSFLSTSYLSTTVSAADDYAYRDTTRYTHSIKLLPIKITDADSKVTTDYSTWKDDAGFTYQIAEVKVEHKETDENGSEKTVTDYDKYYPAVIGYTGSELDIKACHEVSIPQTVKDYLKEKGYELARTDKATVIGDAAFKSTKLKSVDLEGIEYIGSGAMASCPYITVETIPSTVKYMSTGVFNGSGLKTLEFLNKIEDIPDNFCSDTKVSKVVFAYPDIVKTIGKAAFKNTVLTSYILEPSNQPVIIGESAFEGCSQIASLTLPDNTIRVNPYAFKGCTAMKSLALGKNTLVIDKGSFSGCTGLTEVKFNDVLQSIGGGAFEKCSSLATVSDLPESLCDWVAVDASTGYGFGNAVFANCTSLVNLVLPSSLTKVPKELCVGCSSLASISLGGNIDTVCKAAFMGCTNLQEISLADSVTIIEDDAFNGCSKLKKVIVEECSSVGNMAYANCTTLSKVRLIADTYGTGVFSGCTSLTSAEINAAGLSELPAETFSGCVKLNDFGDTDFTKIKIVGAFAFSGCSALTGVNIPNAVIVEDSAFKDCTSLKKIMDKAISVQDYGASCFQNCSSLTQTVNSKASTVGASAFEGSGISALHIEGTVGNTVVFGNKAFANCDNLDSAEVIIPEGIEYSVGKNLFNGCDNLKTCTYTGSEIPEGMFTACNSLTKVSIPKATDVLSSAFKGCEQLRTIEGVSTFKSVATSAFADCFALGKTYCDKNTTFSGDSQYSGCSSIKTAEVSNLTKKMFLNCKSLNTVVLDSNITSIPEQAFEGCSSLKTINLGSIKEFKKSACKGTGISTLELTEVNTIGASAFEGCNSLNKIDVEVESIEAGAFKDCMSLVKADIVTNKVGNNAFANCISLMEVNFPEMGGYSLTTIEYNAFLNNTLLREVIIPKSVTSIGNKAFGIGNTMAKEDFLVVGTPGSAAETYATKNEIPFQDVATYDAQERLKARKKPGDVDINGLITVSDAVKMQRWLTREISSGVYGDNMDVNGDGSINCFDLVMLKRMLLDVEE